MPMEFIPPLVIFLAIIGWTMYDVAEVYKKKDTKRKKSDGIRSWTDKVQAEDSAKQKETSED